MALRGEPKRILVALDTGSLSRMAVEAAARLAIGLQGELEALFVEDAKLRRLAELPFARELGVTSAQPRRFDTVELDRAIAVQAQQMRRVLQDAARKLPLVWTLEVVRGDLVAVVLERTTAADLLVLGMTRRPSLVAARAAQTRARAERRAGRHPIFVLYDGSAAGTRALEAALALERRTRADIVVAVPAPRPEPYAALRKHAEAVLEAQGHAASGCVRLDDARVATIGEAARRHRARAVLLPVADLARAEHEFEGLVDEIACPVVLIK